MVQQVGDERIASTPTQNPCIHDDLVVNLS
jgi:hypothetical protein